MGSLRAGEVKRSRFRPESSPNRDHPPVDARTNKLRAWTGNVRDMLPLSEAGSSIPANLSGTVVTVAGIVIVLVWLALLSR